MKARKKPSQKVRTAPQSEVAVENTAPPSPPRTQGAPMTSGDTVKVCLYSVLLFLAMTVQTGRMSLVLAALAIALSVGKTPLKNLAGHLCVPVVGLLAFAVMNGAAAIYSPFGSDALGEFYKFLAAFSLAVIALMRFERRHVRGLMWGVCAVCGVIALLCIDVAGGQLLFTPFNSVMSALGVDFTSVIENNVLGRVNGIYNDANVTGAITGMSMLLCVYLAHTAQGAKKRLAACFLLGLSAMGFLTAMSRGAMLCFVLAVVVYLVAQGREERVSLFFLLLSTAAGLTIVGLPAMMAVEPGVSLPVLLTLVCGVVIFGLDFCLGQRLANLLRGKGKILAAGVAALAVACVVLVVVAFNVTQPHTFTRLEVLYRACDLAPGDYTLSGDWDDGESTTVTIYSRNVVQATMRQETILYRGAIQDAAFTVPEDAVRVFFQFRGETGDVIREAKLSDGTQLPLRYRFIPETIVFRLQDGLLTSDSFLLRAQFDKDAWTLFTLSPLLGHGLGSTEGLYTAVQPFYYQSLYAHNHILQVMSDMGLLGLVSFLALLLGVAWLLVKNRDKGESAPLLAVWVMMNTHSLMEINFSVRSFQCLALVLLVLPMLAFAQPGWPGKLSEKAAKRVSFAVAGGMCLFLAVFGGLVFTTRMTAQQASGFATNSADKFMSTMKGFATRDVFTPDQYHLAYVSTGVQLGGYEQEVATAAEKLRATGTYENCAALAQNYYLVTGQWSQLFDCSREAIAQKASDKDAWNLQLNFYRDHVLEAMGAENVREFVQQVLQTKAYLDTYSQGRQESIALTESNQAFLETVSVMNQEEIPDETLYLVLAEAALVK